LFKRNFFCVYKLYNKIGYYYIKLYILLVIHFRFKYQLNIFCYIINFQNMFKYIYFNILYTNNKYVNDLGYESKCYLKLTKIQKNWSKFCCNDSCIVQTAWKTSRKFTCLTPWGEKKLFISLQPSSTSSSSSCYQIIV
jgi:hypothetical protein